MIDLNECLVSPEPGGEEVWDLPEQVGRWTTVVTEDDQPVLHAGGSGYGWLAEDAVFPGQCGFVKREWWTLHDVVDVEAAMQRRWRSVLLGHALLSREGVASSVVPPPLDIAVTVRGGFSEPLSVTGYFRDLRTGRSMNLERVVSARPLGAGAVHSLVVCLASAFRAFGHVSLKHRAEVIVHGDIKPANVLVDTLTWTYAIIDCVDGRRYELTGEQPPDTRVLASLPWVPPECPVQSRDGDLTGSSFAMIAGRTPMWDVWSAAMTITWAALGLDPTILRSELVADPDHRWAIAAQLMKRDVAPAIAAMVAKSLHPEPEYRLPPSAFVRTVGDWQDKRWGE